MFWGHCSNLQAWWEHDYDTRLLHSNLSFPLLKELTEAGDLKAKRVFKEEVAKRCLDGYLPVVFFLLEEYYLECLELEEREEIIEYLKKLYHNQKNSFTQFGKALFLTEFCVYYAEKEEVERASSYARKMESLDQDENFVWLWMRIRIWMREFFTTKRTKTISTRKLRIKWFNKVEFKIKKKLKFK